MYMSKLVPRPEAASHPCGRGRYGEHQAVWRFFGDRDDRERDFLFRRMEGGMGGNWFLSVSARRPELPQGWERGWDVAIKEYAPQLAVGQRLHFSLRANPVRSVRDESGRQSRHDVVMDAKKRLMDRSIPPGERPNQAALAYDAGRAWLETRAARLGLDVDWPRLMVDGYQVHEFRKRGGRVRLATLDFSGPCVVADAEALTNVLFQGIGPGKGFGCGLLLVRRC